MTALDVFEINFARQANTMQGDDVNTFACETQFNLRYRPRVDLNGHYHIGFAADRLE